MSGLDFIDNNFQLHSQGGNIINYQAARWTTTKVSDKMYNAFLAVDGSYIIMERDFTNLTIKYFIRKATETLDLDADWTNRESLTYVEYNSLFS